jgi:uncharacterized peroxidase-related enzyme
MAQPSTQEIEASRRVAEEKYGFVPNQIKVLNEHNPAIAKLYATTMDLIEEGELEDREREAVILAVSRYNDCHYCTSTHAGLGHAAGLTQEEIAAINRGGLPEDYRLRALVKTTRMLMDKSGWLDDEDTEALARQGISEADLYEINAIIGLKILSNYVNHVAQTEVDDQVKEMFPIIDEIKGD